MDGLAWNLLLAASGLALAHTLLGPDHYLPFAALSRARGWAPARAMGITAVCGGAHLLSSLVLAALVLGAGTGLVDTGASQEERGSWAAWGLVAFGAAYGLWGLRRAVRRGGGISAHRHPGRFHLHLHGDRPHAHGGARESPLTFWTLLLVFVVGPCEPLIPLLLLPAGRGRWMLTLLTAALFSLVTVATMVVAVRLVLAGASRLSPPPIFGRFRHALAGAIVVVCGLAILYLGL